MLTFQRYKYNGEIKSATSVPVGQCAKKFDCEMKFIASFIAVIVGFIGFTSATICAIDHRNGQLRNFPHRDDMEHENDIGGGKHSQFNF